MVKKTTNKKDEDNKKEEKSNINSGTIAVVFFWVGLWGAITVICEWLFLQMGNYNNPGTQFLIYFLITIMAAYVILTYIGNIIPFFD